jgi:hypothetical protein
VDINFLAGSNNLRISASPLFGNACRAVEPVFIAESTSTIPVKAKAAAAILADVHRERIFSTNLPETISQSQL